MQALTYTRAAMARAVPEKFLVAFAVAGEHRDLVRQIAEAVERTLGSGTVFFDEWFEHYLVSFVSSVSRNCSSRPTPRSKG